MSRIRAIYVVAALLLTGCPDPNLYTTPRTLNPGKVAFQVAPEAISVNHPPIGQAASTPNAHNETSSSPMVSFGVRVGLLNGFDIGVREQDFQSLAMDAKVRLVRSRVDIALDPGLQVTFANRVYFHAPVLFGINFSDRLSVVLSPGFGYAVAIGAGLPEEAQGGGNCPGLLAEGVSSCGNSSTTGLEPAANLTGATVQTGLGFDFRITHTFAIHPELTVIKPLDTNLLMWIGGIGFNIGAQPDYSDLAGTRKGSSSPVPTPPAAPPSAPTLAPVQPASTEIVL